MSYLRSRKNAFYYAFRGLYTAFREESHMRVHLCAAMLAVAGGFWFSISPLEWVAVSGCIALVLVCELFNTAIERACDLVTRERNENIRYIKDVSAAAVLLACALSLVAAWLIFAPYLA